MRSLTQRTRLLIVGALMVSASALAMAVPHAYAAGNTCTWIGPATGTWSTAANWSGCGSVAPQNGDSLVFDSTSFSSNPPTLTNDIANLQLNNISFTGTGIFPFDVFGNGISLSGGITDASLAGASLGMNITLTASQTFSSSALIDLDGTTLAMGNFNLHAVGTSGGEVDFFSALTGTGTLTFDSGSGSNSIDSNNPGFSGPLNINSGRLIINASNTNQLGTGMVTIASGASLQESINSNGTYSIANPITLGGTGTGSTGAIDVHGFSATGTVSFTGAITLTNDATVSLENANADVSGAVSGCGFAISERSGSSGTLSGNLAGSCASSNSSGGSPGGSGNATSTTSSSTNPSVPNTGNGQPSNTFVALALLFVASLAIVTGARLFVAAQAPKL